MKKLFIMMSLLLALTANADFTGTATLTQNTSLFSSGTGGEFRIVATELGTYQSFCLETGELFAPGVSYNYRFNTGAVGGGVGANAVDPYTGQTMDNISVGTAWLYSQFSEGSLTGYAYNYGPDRVASAGKLQQAIWWLENEGGAKNQFVLLAEGGLGLDDAKIRLDSEGAYGVVAMNLYDNSGHNVQDQLAIVVPEPLSSSFVAGLLMSLPVGLAIRHRLQKQNKL